MNKMECIHNQRCQYTDGFYCEDCQTFFHKDSPTYRSTELLSDLWMVLHNINCDVRRKTGRDADECDRMCDKIGIGKEHQNYDEIISEAEEIIARYGKTAESATVVIGD